MAFIVYATYAGFVAADFEYGPYLSPMYSPLLFGPSAHAWFGGPFQPDWWPTFLKYSPAVLILWAPGGFRVTCYYYRGAYYKAFWADPPGCAVGEPRKKYLGERWFPLVLQNIHRYFMYVGVIFICILTYDAWIAMWFPADGIDRADSAARPREFGIGVGTIVLAAQRGVPGLLDVRLPLAAPPRRWRARRDVRPAGPQDRLRVCELPEPLAYEVGLDQSVLGRVHRPVRPDVRDGHLDGLPDSLRLDGLPGMDISTMTCSSSAPAAPD